MGRRAADAPPARRAHADDRRAARRRARARRARGDAHRVRERDLRPLRLRRRDLATRAARSNARTRRSRARSTTPGGSASYRRTKPRRSCRRCTRPCAATRAGMVTRPDFWWPQVFWHDVARRQGALRRRARRRARRAPTASSAYEITGEWSGGLSGDRKLSVFDIQATNATARAALWQYLFGVDLVGAVTAHMLADRRTAAPPARAIPAGRASTTSTTACGWRPSIRARCSRRAGTPCSTGTW